ncbi:cyclase family protein [Vibrio rotiferianus]|uniref:cyclase family protein n=1 Tax=Vibrio rotiferianus TaxID=190895 RepID=UPI000B5A0400|nr:cyclase family protein [Vibrio rotiferianus]ASI96132.1 hypothetical protein BSZ04_14200 [Vibrio rotiferianus]
MPNTQKLHIDVNETHPAYQWAKRQSDSVEAFGHIGTHIDCYTKAPLRNCYHIDTVVIDCRQGMPSLEMVRGLDVGGKGVVLYTGNLEHNGYGTADYGQTPTHLDSQVLDHLLREKTAFILIDSYGIGAHGDEHISYDKRCEASDCFVIENIMLSEVIAKRICSVSIEFDRDSQSTGKRCEVVAVLSE